MTETTLYVYVLMKRYTSIEDPMVIRKILAHLHEKAVLVATGMMPQCRAPPPTQLFV